MNRPPSLRTELLRLGFQDVDASLALLKRLGAQADPLMAIFGRTADPDAALAALLDLADRLDQIGEGGQPGQGAAMLTAVADDEGTAMRLLCVLGASRALADHLARHPEHWRELTDPELGCTRPAAFWMREQLLGAVGADPWAPLPVATLPEAAAKDALRVTYRRILLRLAGRDLAHHMSLDDVAAELSDMAAATLEAALAVARAELGERHDRARLAVIAMGKCGGHELNYVSDVDVIFCYEAAEGVADQEAQRVATMLASRTMQVCSDHTGEGTIWPVDANLRPEGRKGSLVRTLASYESYYERWASTWEFQALLKARPVAGDLALGRDFLDALAPMVWSAAARPDFVDDTRAMRRRVLDHIPAREAARQLKLGSGGLRDVEFAVQLLQLVHGQGDPSVRAPTTLSALAQLTREGYVGRDDGEALHRAYVFLRTLEHRIQLHDLRRAQVVPEDEESLRRLGRSLGFRKEPVAELDEAWDETRREVRRLHEKLFYRPLLNAVARIPGGATRLSTGAAKDRLAALGYADPAAALRHLESLTAGVSRRATVQRALLPVLLGWFADSPDPDAGLFGFRRISEALGDTTWYLRDLRDEGEVAERLARVLATSRYATDLLQREPQGVRLLAGDLTPLSAEALTKEMTASAGRHDDPEAAVRAVRAVRRRELLRNAVGDLLDVTEVDQVGAALSRLTDATLSATLEVVTRKVCAARGLDEPPTRMALVAMGRYGGFELSYASDADVMFVHDPLPGADGHQASQYAMAVANEIRTLLAAAGSDPPLEIDAGLRPEGKSGPLVRTLDAYAAYYAKWSKVWEAQALLRADAVVGDEGLRERFTAVIDPIRYPAGGLGPDDIIEVQRIKARVDSERLPRGADPKTHLKLGRGGLADVEWTIQLLQMRHAGEVEALRTPRTLEALYGARDAGLLTAEDADTLIRSWRLVSSTRNAITLVRGKPGDQVPGDGRERAAVASVLGYPEGASTRMLNDYLRTTRLARQVVDRVFWG